MIPWIQVYSNITTHPKTARLADELKLSSSATSPNIIAVGILVGIWTWAVQNAYDGDLSTCNPTVIADACRWKKKPELLINALKNSGYLDDNMHLHDWDEYAVLFIDQEDARREKTRERVKRYRDRKRNAECNGYSNVTVTPCNAPTIPNHTIPNITNTLKDLKDIDSGGGDTRAREKNDPVDEYMDEHVNTDQFYGSDDVKADVSKLTQRLFIKLTHRQPTAVDESQVFKAVTKAEKNPDGTWARWIDANAQDLLIHAFRIAAESGKDGDWKYINGILRRFAQRGITTVDDEETFEVSRSIAKEVWT